MKDRNEGSNSDFNGRHLNVLKIRDVTDAEIAIAEIKYSIDQIAEDIRTGFGDEEWERGARIALADYEHKARLLVIKRAALIEARKEQERTTRAARFHEAAFRILTPQMYQTIVDSAESTTAAAS